MIFYKRAHNCFNCVKNIYIFLYDVRESSWRTIHKLRFSPVGKMMGDWRTIFVTGGAGYIGSHCIVELLECGYDVVAIDNFANSVTETDGESAALKRVEQITGKKVTFYNCDLLDREKLETVFNQVSCLLIPYYIFHLSLLSIIYDIKRLTGFFPDP